MLTANQHITNEKKCATTILYNIRESNYLALKYIFRRAGKFRVDMLITLSSKKKCLTHYLT